MDSRSWGVELWVNCFAIDLRDYFQKIIIFINNFPLPLFVQIGLEQISIV